MKMFKFIAVNASFVHALRQNTVNTCLFCYGATKHCKYQRFGLQCGKKIAMFVKVAILKKAEIGAV